VDCHTDLPINIIGMQKAHFAPLRMTTFFLGATARGMARKFGGNAISSSGVYENEGLGEMPEEVLYKRAKALGTK
jgi:hypothetical protein